MINTSLYKDNDLVINGIKNYHAALVMTLNSEITLFDKDSRFFIPPHSIVFLEKGVTFNVKVVKKGSGVPYRTFAIDDKIVSKVLKIFDVTHCEKENITIPSIRKLEDRVFIVNESDVEEGYFDKVIESKVDETLLVCKLAYLFSKVKKRDYLLFSISVSASKSFSDKVRELVEKQLSKKWKISELAEQLHCSEITIRKKLERENINFNQIILDVRMNHAAKLILSTDYNVTSVSAAIGISSTSYFIKLFKYYYGITPKQYYLTLKQVT